MREGIVKGSDEEQSESEYSHDGSDSESKVRESGYSHDGGDSAEYSERPLTHHF
jgi:hypothetical protein